MTTFLHSFLHSYAQSEFATLIGLASLIILVAMGVYLAVFFIALKILQHLRKKRESRAAR